ncbi:hypothetical protein [Sphaerisporangium rhizosphaerae]|uniref:Uncharacterized protein n=1 Tax=Sphaerisporangium rhizosphaerae TaxID=2269375 RepID=A0ABW2PFK0_9ACTN
MRIIERNGRDRPPAIRMDEHHSATTDEPRWLPFADVIILTPDRPTGRTPAALLATAATALRTVLADHPGCLVAAHDAGQGRCLVGTRDGQIVAFRHPSPWAVASAAHAWTVHGGRLADLRAVPVTVTEGAPRPANPSDGEPVRLEVRRVL